MMRQLTASPTTRKLASENDLKRPKGARRCNPSWWRGALDGCDVALSLRFYWAMQASLKEKGLHGIIVERPFVRQDGWRAVLWWGYTS